MILQAKMPLYPSCNPNPLPMHLRPTMRWQSPTGPSGQRSLAGLSSSHGGEADIMAEDIMAVTDNPPFNPLPIIGRGFFNS